MTLSPATTQIDTQTVRNALDAAKRLSLPELQSAIARVVKSAQGIKGDALARAEGFAIVKDARNFLKVARASDKRRNSPVIVVPVAVVYDDAGIDFDCGASDDNDAEIGN